MAHDTVRSESILRLRESGVNLWEITSEIGVSAMTIECILTPELCADGVSSVPHLMWRQCDSFEGVDQRSEPVAAVGSSDDDQHPPAADRAPASREGAVGPNAWAICTANVPTPPAAPLIRAVCPG